MASGRILIVDDDVDFSRAIALRCKSSGFDAQVSSDPLQALMLLVQNPPDLVILDISMPFEDGLSLCDRIANSSQLAPLPVIVLSGDTGETTLRRCKQLGAHHVAKGSQAWANLLPLINKLLDRNKAEETPESSEVVASEIVATSNSVRASDKPKILVIDDDHGISQALQVKLWAYGVDVVRAFSGMQGYWMALKELPKVIVIDYTMPDGTGNYILSRLQRHSLTKDIPAIVLTGRTQDYSIKRAMYNLGAVAFLTKPLDFEALLAELRNHIPIGRPLGSAARAHSTECSESSVQFAS